MESLESLESTFFRHIHSKPKLLEVELAVEDEVVEVTIDAAIVIALVMDVTVFYLIDASIRVGEDYW